MKERVGFGPRLGAALIDMVIAVVLMFTVGGVIGGMLGSAVGGVAGSTPADALGGGAVGAMVGMALASAVIALLYGMIEIFTAASPGKMALKLKIGTENGTPASTQVLATRYAAKNSAMLLNLLAGITGIGIISSLGSLVGLAIFIGCFFVLNAKRQAFHDMAAKTAVFQKDVLAS